MVWAADTSLCRQIASLLADVGGISALFIGWSVITVLEFLELALLLCTHGCCGYRTERGAPNKDHEASGDADRDTTPVESVSDACGIRVVGSVGSGTNLNSHRLIVRAE